MGINKIVKNDKILWLLSDDHRLCEKTSVEFSEYEIIRKPQLNGFPKPDLFVSGCEYDCRIEKCANIFRVSAMFPAVPHIVARSVLAERFSWLVQEVIWSEFSEFLNGGRPKNEMTKLIPSDHPDFFSFSVQCAIVEQRGNVYGLEDLEKINDCLPARFPEKFSIVTGMAVKRLLMKIRMCHALRDFIVLKKSVKETAYAYGYKPFSFSRVFYKKFGVWPSKIDSTK